MKSAAGLTVSWPGGIGDPFGPNGQTIPVGGRRKSHRATRKVRKAHKASRKAHGAKKAKKTRGRRRA